MGYILALGAYGYPGIDPVPTEYDTQFYVGPLGDMRPLPAVESGVDTTVTAIGGTHTSLTGAFTRDVFGYKRSWTWSYPLLTDRQARHVEAIARRLVPGPLYLLDPRRRNRLPEQIASGGSLLRSTTGFIPSNTTAVQWRRLNYPAADSQTLPSHSLLRGCLEWQLLAAAGATLELAGHALDGRHNVPVLSNEVLWAGFWATAPAAVSLGGGVTIYDASGAVVSTQPMTDVAMSPTEWRWVGLGLVCPSSAAYLRLAVTTTADSPIGSVFTTAYTVERYHPTYVPGLLQYCDDPDLGDWELGGGAPQVVPTPGSTSYVRPGLQSAALTLIER